jgi:hypothetical protein
MVSSGYIPRFFREMELGANYMLERGILISYVGWHREDRSFKQQIDLAQIGEMSPDLYRAIESGEEDAMLIAMLQNIFDGVTEKRGKKALKELRKNGTTELPVVRRQVNAPEVKTLAPHNVRLIVSGVLITHHRNYRIKSQQMDGMRTSLNTLLINTGALISTALSVSKKVAALSALLIMLTRQKNSSRLSTDTSD